MRSSCSVGRVSRRRCRLGGDRELIAACQTALMRTVTESQVNLPDGATLHTYDTGPDSGDLVVLYHHGTPNLGAPPTPLFPLSDELGVRWVSYDRPGYGGSTPAPGRDIGSAGRPCPGGARPPGPGPVAGGGGP